MAYGRGFAIHGERILIISEQQISVVIMRTFTVFPWSSQGFTVTMIFSNENYYFGISKSSEKIKPSRGTEIYFGIWNTDPCKQSWTNILLETSALCVAYIKVISVCCVLLLFVCLVFFLKKVSSFEFIQTNISKCFGFYTKNQTLLSGKHWFWCSDNPSQSLPQCGYFVSTRDPALQTTPKRMLIHVSSMGALWWV